MHHSCSCRNAFCNNLISAIYILWSDYWPNMVYDWFSWAEGIFWILLSSIKPLLIKIRICYSTTIFWFIDGCMANSLCYTNDILNMEIDTMQLKFTQHVMLFVSCLESLLLHIYICPCLQIYFLHHCLHMYDTLNSS